MRAAIYTRLSRDSETSTSIERQREACEQYAKARGWEVVASAEDVDVSGSKIAPADRPGFASLLASQAEVIVAYRLDRVARSVGDFAALLRDLEQRRVALVSATEPFDLTDPIGKALVYLVAIFAEMEAEAIGARVRSSIAKLRTTSRWSHGRAPYGYVIVPMPDGQPGKTLAIDDEAAAVLQECAERVLNGERIGTIVRDLNARGIKPQRGDLWRDHSLRQILTSDHVLGRVRHRGALVRGEDGEPLQPFTAILDVATVEALRALLEPTPMTSSRTHRMLSGLCRCAGCGTTMTLTSSRSGQPAYRCKTQKARGCSAPAQMLAEWIEPWAEREFLQRYGSSPVLRPARAVTPVGLADLDAQVREVTSALAIADEADEQALLSLLRTLKARRAELTRAPAPDAMEPLTYDDDGETRTVTIADVWDQQPDYAKRDTMLSTGFRVQVRAGQRGIKAFNPERLAVLNDEEGAPS